MLGNSVSVAMMEKSMSALWQRTQAVSHNVANEDTPGFKAKRLAFENLLRKELNSMQPPEQLSQKEKVARIQSLEPVEYADTTTVGRADGNNVDIDSEHLELARIGLQYYLLQERISGHYNTMKYAITGGR